ncbi:hypothetical protein ACD589_24215 [Rhizobium sp. 814_E9_N1_1]|uniref:hypothetical protein n=1 Tax=unclassified Rhizobium TaxID=2613769 RepID=UPI003F225714
MKTKLTSAADMARSVGIDRKLFGEHFERPTFPWRGQSDAGTAEINSEEHVSMQDMLAILRPTQDEPNHSVTRL